jgi:DNA-binding transcriptional regulator YiaG
MKKTTIFNHLGFPINLVDWPHVEVDGELVPDVNYVKLEELMFMLLPLKPTRLNGAEVKFIRHHLEMTQKKFAKWLEDETDDSTVAVWEKADLEPTCMSKAMERSLRMQLIGLILEKQRRKTVKLNDVMELLSNSISAKKSSPVTLSAKNYFPIPTKLPKELFAH